MATNFFFNNFGASQEQLLIDDLVRESIKIYGQDMYYLPRTTINIDNLLGEPSYSEFNTHYLLEMYIKNVEGFEGQGDFLSKFNLEIRDQITFTISRRSFNDEVGAYMLMERPREGDLIFFPLNNKVYQIKFVEHEAIFYQLGALQTYDLVCELFEYSNEVFNTGIQAIDNLQKSISLNLYDFGLQAENGLAITDEDGFDIVQESYDIKTQDTISDNKEIQSRADGILDFTELDPFSEGLY